MAFINSLIKKNINKLNIINNWIEIEKLIKNDEYGFALCLYLKYRNRLDNKGINIEFRHHSLLFKHIKEFNNSGGFIWIAMD